MKLQKYHLLNESLGAIHLRRRQVFQDFWPLPPYCWQFFTTICRQIWQIMTPPPPLENAGPLAVKTTCFTQYFSYLNTKGEDSSCNIIL